MNTLQLNCPWRFWAKYPLNLMRFMHTFLPAPPAIVLAIFVAYAFGQTSFAQVNASLGNVPFHRSVSLDDFVLRWSGVPVDFDQAYGFQCVDLVRRYATDLLELNEELPEGNAYSIFERVKSAKFRKVNFSPGAVSDLSNDRMPQKGDIIFWKETRANGHAGHVAIVVAAKADSFVSFDQNFCSRSGSGLGDCAPRLVEHTYENIAGWLSPYKK